MLKPLKYALLTVSTIALLLVLGITLFFTLNDANEFKPDIEAQAKESIGINLNIDGKLSWSLFPLGILIEKIQILDQDMRPFARAAVISSKIDLFSLAAFSPKIKSVRLSGLDLKLAKDKKGQANWDNLLPTQALEPTTDKGQEKQSSNSEQENSINFLVETFEISDSKVRFESEQDEVKVAINDIDLKLANIALDGNTPISLQFELVDEIKKLTVSTQLSGTLKLSNNLDSIEVEKFTSTHSIVSKAFKKPIKLGLHANVEVSNVSPGGLVELRDITLELDDSTWQGNLSYAMDDQSIKAQLDGDQLNLDNYLPSEPEPSSSNKKNSAKKSTAKAPDGPLLPLETLRQLKLDIQFKQQEIIAKQLKTTDIESHIRADNGLLELVTLKGKLYQGGYNFSAKIDARNNEPVWSSKQSINKVDIAPIAAALGKIDSVAGKLTLDASAQSIGNNINRIKSKATAKAQFNIDDGHLAGINANKLACEGFALLNRDFIVAREWPKYTPFSQLEGQATLKQQQVSSSISVAASGLKMTGNGKVDLKQEEVDYQARVNVIGELGEHACRVNEKLKEVGVPVRCQGSLTSDPAKLCKLDEGALKNELKRAAVNEGKRKLGKEVDRALDKYLGGEKGNKKDIKNLLNKLF